MIYANEHLVDLLNDEYEKVKRLQSDCEKLLECVRWYGHQEHWDQLTPDKRYKSEGDGIFYISRTSPTYLDCDNGKRAREILKEIEG